MQLILSKLVCNDEAIQFSKPLTLTHTLDTRSCLDTRCHLFLGRPSWWIQSENLKSHYILPPLNYRLIDCSFCWKFWRCIFYNIKCWTTTKWLRNFERLKRLSNWANWHHSWPICQSANQTVNLPICQLANLTICQSATICQLANLPICHFANLPNFKSWYNKPASLQVRVQWDPALKKKSAKNLLFWCPLQMKATAKAEPFLFLPRFAVSDCSLPELGTFGILLQRSKPLELEMSETKVYIIVSSFWRKP